AIRVYSHCVIEAGLVVLSFKSGTWPFHRGRSCAEPRRASRPRRTRNVHSQARNGKCRARQPCGRSRPLSREGARRVLRRGAAARKQKRTENDEDEALRFGIHGLLPVVIRESTFGIR